MEALVASKVSLWDELYFQEAVQIRKFIKLFIAANDTWENLQSDVHKATSDDFQLLQQWEALDHNVMSSNGMQHVEDHGSVTVEHEQETSGQVFNLQEDNAEISLTAVDPTCLLQAQCRVYEIVKWHLNAMLSAQNVSQLLKQIQGEGRTGKSKVVQTITKYFEEKDSEFMLVKTAYRGVAASIINRKMTHTIAKISIDKKEISLEVKVWLQVFWKRVKYLINR